jgi:hypothetical protein
MTETMKNRIMIFGPKADATYVVEFRTAEGEALAISIPQQLCTLRVRRRRRLTQHSLPGGPLRLYLGRTLHRLIASALPGAFPHSITSSARASSVGGISRPSILAVWALMTSSNLLDCTTGRSAGFAPLRMRPV